MKKTILFGCLTILLFFHQCKNPVEQKCEGICTFIEKCAMEANKVQIPVDHLLKKMHIQCLGNCTMNHSEFLNCQKESENSCGKFFECLMSSGVVN